jgi:alkanesulfonate monooxygenase SsuD/methylene tetrahydromethanopterin reductase-like flavin-dependent oxidoreductase (luciferase family)
MRVGIIILPERRWPQARLQWQRAEEYGFAHAWTYDHIGWRSLVAEPWFDAVPTLAAAALSTSRIRLGTMVASPNFRHPVHFAREITALDDLSQGRLSLGIGSGGVGYDAFVLGQPELSPRARNERFSEFVELLDGLFREQPLTWSGKYYRAVEAYTTPGCVQRPRVPFIIAARGPKAVRLAARYGQGWVTNGGPVEDTESWWRGVTESVRQFNETGSTIDRYVTFDPAPVFSLSSVDYFEECMGRAQELGFTDVITHWPRPDGPFQGTEAVMEEVVRRWCSA